MLPTTFPQHSFYLTLLPLESTVFHEHYTRAANIRRRYRFRNLSNSHTTDPEITEPFPSYTEPDMQSPNTHEQGRDDPVDALGRSTSQILQDFWKAREEEAMEGGESISSSEMHDDLQMLGARGLVARESRCQRGKVSGEVLGDLGQGRGGEGEGKEDGLMKWTDEVEMEAKSEGEGLVDDGKRGRFRMAIRRLGGGRLEKGKDK